MYSANVCYQTSVSCMTSLCGSKKDVRDSTTTVVSFQGICLIGCVCFYMNQCCHVSECAAHPRVFYISSLPWGTEKKHLLHTHSPAAVWMLNWGCCLCFMYFDFGKDVFLMQYFVSCSLSCFWRGWGGMLKECFAAEAPTRWVAGKLSSVYQQEQMQLSQDEEHN